MRATLCACVATSQSSRQDARATKYREAHSPRHGSAHANAQCASGSERHSRPRRSGFVGPMLAMPYRDELDALRSREAVLERELDEARRMRVAVEKRALPLLEELRVASPCPEKWDDMIGDDRARFCGRCAKDVYDLSAMSRAEAESFLKDREGPVCITFRRRRDGKIMTRDCPVGARRRRFGIGVVALAVVGAAGAFALDFDAGNHVERARARETAPPQQHSSRTTGCPCLPADPLCSCL